MREDERSPLCKTALQKQLRDEARFAALFSMIPLLFVTLLAVLFTVMVSGLYAALAETATMTRPMWSILRGTGGM